MNLDEQHLRRAIRLAMNGRGLVEPNPMVGCVIVKSGRVIGEGFHARFGGLHAEPAALASCTESPEGATAYVTLEPCCHTDKKTPPCVPKLIAAKLSRVVVGCLDPNPKVNGNGIAQLREAGIAVDGPMMAAECKQLIAPFMLRSSRNSPYSTMKWAVSADGKVAGPNGHRLQISNATSSHLVHLMRSRTDSIAVGINTVLNDDPNLAPRDVPILRTLLRIALDSCLRIRLDSQLVRTAKQIPTAVFCFRRESGSIKANQLRELGVRVTGLDPLRWTNELPGRRLSLHEMLIDTGGSHIFVEAGPTLAKGFFEQNAADRLWVIRSQKIIGDDTAPVAAAIPDYFIPTGEVDLGGDILREYLNTRSPVFFAAAKSADLVLAMPGASPL